MRPVLVNGPNAHPCFKFLRSFLRDTLGTPVRWNFTKFLVNKQGLPCKRFASTISPAEIESFVEYELNL
jgi:glutathione peroxidase